MLKRKVSLGIKIIFIFYIIVIISYFIDFIYFNFFYSGGPIIFISHGIVQMQLYMFYVLGDSLGYLIYNMTLYSFEEFLSNTFVFAATLLYIFSLVGLFLKDYFFKISRILFIVLSCLGILGVIWNYIDYLIIKLDFFVIVGILISLIFILINIFIITYLFFNKNAKEFFYLKS